MFGERHDASSITFPPQPNRSILRRRRNVRPTWGEARLEHGTAVSLQRAVADSSQRIPNPDRRVVGSG